MTSSTITVASASPDRRYGNGVLLWFEVDDFDAVVDRGTRMVVNVVMAPHRNPPQGEPGGPAHSEFWVHDPDGYTVVLASPDCESPLSAPVSSSDS